MNKEYYEKLYPRAILLIIILGLVVKLLGWVADVFIIGFRLAIYAILIISILFAIKYTINYFRQRKQAGSKK